MAGRSVRKLQVGYEYNLFSFFPSGYRSKVTALPDRPVRGEYHGYSHILLNESIRSPLLGILHPIRFALFSTNSSYLRMYTGTYGPMAYGNGVVVYLHSRLPVSCTRMRASVGGTNPSWRGFHLESSLCVRAKHRFTCATGL